MTASLAINHLVVGDALATLRRLPSASVDQILTSPPYFRLRNYGVDGQSGSEQHVDDWVAHLRAVLAEVHRVLTPTGTLWLNVGDSYSTHHRQGASRKSLLLGPERLVLSLVRDGWLLRNKIIWAKPNPMPTSVRDRLMAGHEYLYVFAKQPDYFFDLDAVRQPHRSRPTQPRTVDLRQADDRWNGSNGAPRRGLASLKADGRVGHPLGKNPGDVWVIASSHQGGDHHATFPLQLAERAVAAGCPEARCRRCARPFRRPVVRALGGTAVRNALQADCTCDAGASPGVVLDPFMGSGTTAVAAERLGRDWRGIEINPTFAAQACGRLQRARAGTSGVRAA